MFQGHSSGCITLLLIITASSIQAAGPVPIGDRRELFVLPVRQALEGVYSEYETVLRDGELLRMYYRGLPVPSAELGAEVTCVAESRDGVHWTRPDLGLFEVNGTKANNVHTNEKRLCTNLDAEPFWKMSG